MKTISLRLPACSALATAAFVLLGGCKSATVDCGSVAVPSVSVQVRDAATGQDASTNSHVILARGATVLDSVAVGLARSGLVVVGQGDVGALTLRVRKAGYQLFTREVVVQTSSTCNFPSTEQVVADLVRTP